jgi:hypothetical protein
VELSGEPRFRQLAEQLEPAHFAGPLGGDGQLDFDLVCHALPWLQRCY